MRGDFVRGEAGGQEEERIPNKGLSMTEEIF